MGGGIIALITSPSTADAVCGPPAPGPDSVISVIAGDSIVTALNGPLTDASGWPGYRNAGCTRTEMPPSRRSAVPISLSDSPRSFAYSMSSAVTCVMPSYCTSSRCTGARNASRARIAIFAAASLPFTSSVGSASA